MMILCDFSIIWWKISYFGTESNKFSFYTRNLFKHTHSSSKVKQWKLLTLTVQPLPTKYCLVNNWWSVCRQSFLNKSSFYLCGHVLCELFISSIQRICIQTNKIVINRIPDIFFAFFFNSITINDHHRLNETTHMQYFNYNISIDYNLNILASSL